MARAQLTLALAFVPSLSAQSMFDRDITAAGHHLYAVDALSYVAPATAGGWLWLNPRVYKGFAHNVELGAGVSYYSHPSGGFSAFQPSIEWRAARDASATDSRRGLTLTAWEAVGPVRFSGSWLSGTNFYGYKTGTVTYTVPSGRWYSVGYSQGNASWHNAGPYFSTGRAF